MQMRNSHTAAKRGVLMLTPLAFLISMSASAAIAPAARDAMKRDLGMTNEQVSQYEIVERVAARQGRTVAKAQGARFAGSWIERKPNGEHQFVVGTTSLQPQVGPDGVVVRNTRFNLIQLSAAKNELDLIRANTPAGVYGWSVDVRR